MRWRTVDGETIVRESETLALGTLSDGLLDRGVLLEMLRWFVVFEDEGTGHICGHQGGTAASCIPSQPRRPGSTESS